MRIAVSGTACIGKSTFINDFKKEWPMYKSPEKTYRDIIREQNLNINQLGDEESQRIILDSLIESTQTAKGDYQIFDRCTWDNLVYTIYLYSQGRVSDSFVKDTITLVRESLVYYDIIFFLPICKQSPVKVVPSEQRDTDLGFRESIDIIFKSLMDAYQKNSNVYYPFKEDKGSPAFIEVFGTPQERIQLCKLYINEKGNIFGDDDSLIADEINNMDPDAVSLAREAFGLHRNDLY